MSPTIQARIAEWLEAARTKGATHLIVMVDDWDHCDYPVAVLPDQDVLKAMRSGDRVIEVYSLICEHSIESQLAEARAHHQSCPPRPKTLAQATQATQPDRVSQREEAARMDAYFKAHASFNPAAGEAALALARSLLASTEAKDPTMPLANLDSVDPAVVAYLDAKHVHDEAVKAYREACILTALMMVRPRRWDADQKRFVIDADEIEADEALHRARERKTETREAMRAAAVILANRLTGEVEVDPDADPDQA